MAEIPRHSTLAAARLASIPRATLFHWIRAGKVSAPEVQLLNGKAVRLWTDHQIQEIQNLKGTFKLGRKKKTRRAGAHDGDGAAQIQPARRKD
jgi:hypothetical protein